MFQESSLAEQSFNHVPSTEKLQTLLITKSFPKCNLLSKNTDNLVNYQPDWGADYFGLEKSSIFQQRSEVEKAAILKLINLSIHTEIYWLEKLGVIYTSKMANLAKNKQEKIIYTVFQGEEVHHLAKVIAYLPHHPSQLHSTSLYNLLKNVVEKEDKSVMLFIFQVVFKGWLVSHYQNLANHCLNQNLAQTLTNIVPEESRQHIMGITLSKEINFSHHHQRIIIEVLTQLLEIMQSHLALINSFETVLGYLSYPQKRQLWQQLGIPQRNHQILSKFRSLIAKETSGNIERVLAAREAFDI